MDSIGKFFGNDWCEKTNLALRKDYNCKDYEYKKIKGNYLVVTGKFNPVDNHFGTDIVAESNTIVSAVLDGTVIFASWTLETGYVIEIQHGNNIISVYKHNAELLKDIGTVVSAGETISIIGYSIE